MSPRVVTVCIEGHPAKDGNLPYPTTLNRLKWLRELTSQVDARWENLETILLPGGFLYIDDYIGHLSEADRIGRLAILSDVNRAVASLSRSPGAFIIAGVDGKDLTQDIGGDQFCVAWNSKGVAAIGRKIFPVRGDEAEDLVCYIQDFSTLHRLVTLPSGFIAMLCACYDGYGVAKSAGIIHDAAWENSVRYIANVGGNPRDYESASGQVDGLRTCFSQLLTNNKVRVAFVSIHSFLHNATSYWQRHGLNGASLAINGFAYGAAHFETALPSSFDVSVLAASAGNAHAPVDWFMIETQFGRALVRLFI